MIRKIIQRTRNVLAFEKALAMGTPLINGRETRRVSRAIRLDFDKACALMDQVVPFDGIEQRTERVTLSGDNPVGLAHTIAEDGAVEVRSISGSTVYREGRDYALDREAGTVAALRPGVDLRQVEIEYLAIDRSARETYFERAMEWAKNGG